MRRLKIKLYTNNTYNMDCIKGMKKLKNGIIDLIVTDPPYYIETLQDNLQSQSLRRPSKNNIFYDKFDHFNNLNHYKRWIKKVLLQFKLKLKPKAQVYMFFSYHHLWIKQMIIDMGFRYYKPLIWYKPDTMGVFPNQYGCNYEIIHWFRKKGDIGEVKINIGCSQRDVHEQKSTKKSYRKECGHHPTPKPLKLIRKYVKNGSNKGDLILDPFMGSGTTAKACIQSDRRFIGFELNEKYHKICLKRIKDTVNQNSLNSFINETEDDKSNDIKKDKTLISKSVSNIKQKVSHPKDGDDEPNNSNHQTGSKPVNNDWKQCFGVPESNESEQKNKTQEKKRVPETEPVDLVGNDEKDNNKDNNNEKDSVDLTDEKNIIYQWLCRNCFSDFITKSKDTRRCKYCDGKVVLQREMLKDKWEDLKKEKEKVGTFGVK